MFRQMHVAVTSDRPRAFGFPHVPPFCFVVNSRKTRNIAWESAQLSTWVKFMACDWLSLNRLGNTGSRGRSKNNLRGIMMGIGPIWGSSLTP